MPSSADIKVVCVAPALLGRMWPHIGAWLLKGQITITPSMHESLVQLSLAVLEARAGKIQIWAVIDDREKRCIAAMRSKILGFDGERLLWVEGMAGRKLRSWGRPLSRALAVFAREERCDAIRFAGREGLTRVYEGVRVIGDHSPGVKLLERAAL